MNSTLIKQEAAALKQFYETLDPGHKHLPYGKDTTLDGAEKLYKYSMVFEIPEWLVDIEKVLFDRMKAQYARWFAVEFLENIYDCDPKYVRERMYDAIAQRGASLVDDRMTLTDKFQIEKCIIASDLALSAYDERNIAWAIENIGNAYGYCTDNFEQFRSRQEESAASFGALLIHFMKEPKCATTTL